MELKEFFPFWKALTPDQQALLADYAAAPEKGKLARLTLYRRRGLWKYGLNRRIGQILWW